MKKQIICLLLLVFIFTVSLYSFDSPQEKLKANLLISKIQDPKVKKELLYNVSIGNLDSLKAVKEAINNYLEGEAKSYYEAAGFNPSEAVGDLKEKLHDVIINHVCIGYSRVRKLMYGKIDNENGLVEGVYTGRKFEVAPTYITIIISSRGSEAEECTLNFSDTTTQSLTKSFLNCEHTWPQSFFNKKEPMRSDAFHLFPTDSDANSRRGSYPFGEVVDTVWSQGGSKLGYDARGRMVFEPRDKQKGNTARAMFYFSTCYGYSIDKAQEKVLRKWNKMDPPDEYEKLRNEAIYYYQKNRNPFIDHPEYVDMIKDF